MTKIIDTTSRTEIKGRVRFVTRWTANGADVRETLTDAEAATGLSDAMVAWKLQSEPWLFLIDAKGMIAGRYEGGLTKEELGPALEKLIAGQPVF